ncbi:protein-cysteine N-palmitoyltransferase HHAT-like protein isoform X1 [Rhinatrema bivittatum]|uniref:protein-cysteine N-palmitoyltransferase HHAT-like protein isoform X1 n=2 Tax=Rhinatrema bivittatum TaxID=194408 RepID=UPI00112B185E|nr:protein-cysteine N-palmitoyltransferase HHAT-like protein isoform X1 [Rhinatrema bivittatum]XP_029444190.1 protein-cysteine N-palmitoyltransferase HHAT-like protein isoform X1 [Rhinatrema bivittatum]XP_029444191.1 protein-cysteine N-palmitoyltransferase HHAT-like protein isoform X1 [Rhinatrema bivittatum]XP_029444192.1 protein-cysteine N-palmitoyltransferase HHAT-like protein isoform X1 [Rhinatrema bivittatum]
MGIKAVLPQYELGFYALIVTCALVYSLSDIFEVSRENMNRKTFREHVSSGWHYFGRKMDVADFEWVMWFTTFRNYIIFALSGHILFAKVFSMLLPQGRSWVYMIYGMLAVYGIMGNSYLMLILSHCVLLYSISLVKKRWLCFVAGVCSLATFKVEPFSTWQNGFVTGTFDLQDVLFYGGSGFTIMRCMSFALENCERKDGNYSPLELLKYNFYLPFFFFGPIMTFDRFHTQINTSDVTRKENEMWDIQVRAVVHLGAIILVDVLFHFLYILTIPSDLKVVNRASDWAVAGLAYSNLVYDWIKAAVMFGVINTISRLDHLDPPQPPKCITMLYVFAETHFDRGINDWLCKYVYDFLGEDHDDIKKELMATVSTFAITTLWLGPCEIVYIWSFCNCFGLNFELWVQKFFQLEPFAGMEASMSEAMSRRIRGLFGAANFWAIILYNVLSLNSLDFALLVARRILITGFPISTMSVWFVTYCGVQLIKERERALAIEEEQAKKQKTG